MTDNNKMIRRRDWNAPVGDPRATHAIVQAAKADLERIAPRALNLDRMAILGQLALQRNPALVNASGRSLLLALLDSARAGLEPDGVQGAIVPYKGQAQFMPMIAGLVAVAIEEGCVSKVYTAVVYEGDDFDFVVDSGDEKIMHRPTWDDDKRGSAKAVYAVATLPGGERKIKVMSIGDVEKRRQMSKTGGRSDSPWSVWWDEMAMKTVLKNLLKQVGRKGRRLEDVIQMDHAVETGEPLKDRWYLERMPNGKHAHVEKEVAALPPPEDAFDAPPEDLEQQDEPTEEPSPSALMQEALREQRASFKAALLALPSAMDTSSFAERERYMAARKARGTLTQGELMVLDLVRISLDAEAGGRLPEDAIEPGWLDFLEEALTLRDLAHEEAVAKRNEAMREAADKAFADQPPLIDVPPDVEDPRLR